ncbi:MAG: flagellar hook-length control protein FliK, partial [Hyphomonadaceae bacterium]
PAAAAARAGAQTPSAAKLDADVSPARDAVQQAKQGALGQSANLEQSGDVAAAAPLAAAIVAAATPPQSQSPPSKNAARTENAGALPIAGHGESALPPAAHLAASAPAPPPAPLAQTAQPQPGDADPAPGQTKAEAAADPPPQQSQAPSQPSPAVAPPQTLARAPDAASLLAPAPAPSVSPHELGAQVSHEIVRRFAGGITQFAVRLDPPELGRVDVRLEVGRDQRVSAVIAADNPQALTDLTRSAREIAHALHSAGLELRENGLSFDLSQRQFGHADQNAHNPRPFATSAPETRASPSVSPSVQPLRLERWQGMHVNLVA